MATRSFEQWAAVALGDPGWLLWGKATPDADGECAHPLICHCLDVVAVARVVLRDVLPYATVRRMLDSTGLNEPTAVSWISLLVGLHDLGKATPAFQRKLPDAARVLKEAGFDFDAPATAAHHGVVGVSLIRELLVARGFDVELATQLGRAVAAHHGEFPTDATADDHRGARELGKSATWGEARRLIAGRIGEACGDPTHPLPLGVASDHGFTMLLSGLTSVADWIGSAATDFPYVAPSQDVHQYLAVAEAAASRALARFFPRRPRARTSRSFTELFPFPPWPLHQAAERAVIDSTEPALVVIEAPMGEGKTEAALLLAERLSSVCGHGGLFVGLPTQATANQMFGRVLRYLAQSHRGEPATVQLAHGEKETHEGFQALLRGIYDQAADGSVVAEQWFVRPKRALLASYAVGTIDQALLGVLRTRHGFVRLFGLAGKVVVLDEVHAYDTYTSTLVDRLVVWLRAVGASVVLLSATLPSSRRRELLSAYRALAESSPAPSEAPYPRITTVQGATVRSIGFEPRRRDVRAAIEPVADDAAAVARRIAELVHEGGCAGWICNTVARSQRAWSELRRLRDVGTLPADTRLLLMHSRFTVTARQERERVVEQWLGLGGPRPARAVVVGTQVLEQSLDVDFDLLATDIAPIDLVLQRAGRLHRHDRTGRPAAVANPRILLVRPVGEPLDCPLDEIAVVYDEYVMRRTLLELAPRDTLILPEDIEPLVEAVYVAPAPDEASERLVAARTERHRATREDAQLATIRLLPRPDSADDPFGQFGIYFDDDETSSAHDALRANTRLGAVSAELLCVHAVGDRVCVDPSGNEPVELDRMPSHRTCAALLGTKLRISARGLVRAVKRTPPPAAWQRSALLRGRHPVVFRDGVAMAGQYKLTLDDDLGLVVEREGRTDDER